MLLGNLAERVSETFGLPGTSHLVATTCAAGNHAIAWSAELLKSGAADVMLAVGSDTIGYVDTLGFTRLLLQAPPVWFACCRGRQDTPGRNLGLVGLG